jgi:hypothetical protein
MADYSVPLASLPPDVAGLDIGAITGVPAPAPRSHLDILKELLIPSYLRDTPSSPQANIALADPNGIPRKIGPPSGPATGLQIGTGFAGDAASWLAPELKGLAALKGMAMLPKAGEEAATLGSKLASAMSDRAVFDPILEEAKSASVADLKAAFREMTGYDYYPASGRTGTKSDIVKSLQNWQREKELDSDLHAAQAKLPL